MLLDLSRAIYFRAMSDKAEKFKGKEGEQTKIKETERRANKNSNNAIGPPFNISPIPNLILKKCFLNILYDNVLNFREAHFKKILRIDIAPFFNKKSLSDEEYSEGIKAVKELKRDGYIKLSEENKNIYLLTGKGNQVARLPIEDMKLPSIDILDLLTRPDLMFKIHNDYISGEYENALINALKLLEVTIRSKAKLSNAAFGKKGLIEKAFHPETGVLFYPKATTEPEKKVFLIY
jgi:hypothetical protein